MSWRDIEARKHTGEAGLIRRHELTQGQYARCVGAGVCAKPRKVKGAVGARLPAVGVSWADAVKYCKWTGKRLPSEAEWERAARGMDSRRFPWGRDASCEKANFGNFKDAGLCAGKNPGEIIKVGSRPEGASPDGIHDMAGNVWEWVSDLIDLASGGDNRIFPGRVRGPGKNQRVIRGGSCCSYFAMPTTTNRLSFPPDYADFDIGVRCAR